MSQQRFEESELDIKSFWLDLEEELSKFMEWHPCEYDVQGIEQ